ncbi:uncharacterized protein A4U43_C06F18990 [Asparagus officinalis]|uniref:Uncharacterized protein n=1 Tax=Asparagus officinalis TaxID=4686 RepID=A0A5P1EN14_ASPOF|nr:uncharacterized protein A4U43_C06F18990 [Asparagus officinalis]
MVEEVMQDQRCSAARRRQTHAWKSCSPSPTPWSFAAPWSSTFPTSSAPTRTRPASSLSLRLSSLLLPPTLRPSRAHALPHPQPHLLLRRIIRRATLLLTRPPPASSALDRNLAPMVMFETHPSAPRALAKLAPASVRRYPRTWPLWRDSCSDRSGGCGVQRCLAGPWLARAKGRWTLWWRSYGRGV